MRREGRRGYEKGGKEERVGEEGGKEGGEEERVKVECMREIR